LIDLNSLCALSAACIDYFVDQNRKESPLALAHVTKVVRLVGQKLSSPDGLSKHTAGTILVLTLYERLRGEYGRAATHLHGLYRVVESSGGPSSLFSNGIRGLAGKVFQYGFPAHQTVLGYRCTDTPLNHRADLELSLHFGRRTLFDGNDLTSYQYLVDFAPDSTTIAHAHYSIFELSPNLGSIVLDALWLADFINLATRKPLMDVYSLADSINSVSYRLIKYRPLLESNPVSDLESAFHLGLSALMTTFFLEYGYTLVTFEILQGQLRDCIEYLFHNQVSDRSDVILWLLFSGGVSLFTCQDHVWMQDMLSVLRIRLELHSWDEVHGHLSQFPWINAHHDQSGQILWDSLTNMQA
jgi:hypothetical protein